MLQKEKILQDMFETIGGMTYRCNNDTNWSMDYISKSCKKITGYTQKEFMSKNSIFFGELIEKDYQDYVWESIQDALDKKETFSLKYRIKTKDNQSKLIWDRGSGLFEDDQFIGIEGYMIDITEVEYLKSGLKQAKQQITKNFELGINGMCITGLDKTWIESNDRLCEMLGYSREELHGLTWVELTHPDDLELDLNEFNDLLAGRNDGYTLKKRFIRKDGTVIYTKISVKLIYDDDEQKPMKIIALIQDISELIEKNQKLSAEKEVLQIMLSSIGDGIIAIDINGNITILNKIAEKLTGWLESEAMGRSLTEIFKLIDPNSHKILLNSLQNTIFSEDSFKLKRGSILISKHNTQCKIAGTSSVIKNTQNKIVGAIIVFHDITDILKAAKQKMDLIQIKKILDFLPSIIYVADPITHEIVFINKTGRDAIKEDVVGKKCYRVLQGFNEPCSFCTNDIIKNLDKPYRWEFYNEKLEKYYLIDDQMIEWSDGRRVRIESAVDITENKKTAQEREYLLKKYEDTNIKLKQSNGELEQFAYVASHDLQEPLRMVSSYLQLIKRRYYGKLDQDADDFINYAVDGAIRMKTLIQDLLLFSRVSTRAKPIVSVDLNDVVSSILEDLKLLIKETDANIRYSSLPTVFADKTQITQVISNLINNAIKFRKDNIKPIITINSQQKDQFWEISINDNGIGIESQYYSRIFKLFERLHSKEEYPGTGIGLPICKRIIQRHKGNIWVESEFNAGSTFYFTLPIMEQEI